jgi:hypothetical protein
MSESSAFGTESAFGAAAPAAKPEVGIDATLRIMANASAAPIISFFEAMFTAPFVED